MTRVILDEILRSKLHNLTEPLELCDESGHVVAAWFPSSTCPSTSSGNRRLTKRNSDATNNPTRRATRPLKCWHD